MQTVESLRDGYGLAVVSDAPRYEAWVRLCRLGLQHHFDHVFTFDDTGARKPDPLPFRMALTELGVDRIVLVHAHRSVVRWDVSRAERRTDKLRAVARDADPFHCPGLAVEDKHVTRVIRVSRC